jgi:hypothetical protein
LSSPTNTITLCEANHVPMNFTHIYSMASFITHLFLLKPIKILTSSIKVLFIWLYYTVLHIQCSTVSSASVCTSQRIVCLSYKLCTFARITHIPDKTNLVMIVSMAIRVQE